MPLSLPELWALDHAAAFLHARLADSEGARVLALAPADAGEAVLTRFPQAHLGDTGAARCSGAVWFKPSGNWAGQLAQLVRALGPSAPFAIMISGRLTSHPQPTSAMLVRQARECGFSVERVLGFGSPVTLAAAAAVRGARMASRLDVADRGEAAYRLSVRPKAAARLSLCSLVLARA